MQLEVGQIVEGKITGITNFGVFVELSEGKTGMVHISEVTQTYVSDIKDRVKEGETVKMKVLTIGDNGKISLSIKKAMEPEKRHTKSDFRRENRPEPKGVDPTYTWTPKKSEPASFEDMMNKFKQTSDEKFSDLKRKNPEVKRTKRGAGVR
jgi:S1 RNA binding domain protein